MDLSNFSLVGASVRGDVVSTGKKHRLVWVTGANALMVPFVNQRFPRLRSDVRVDDLLELAASGLPGGVWLIRTSAAYLGSLVGLPRIGRAPASVLKAVEIAFAREQVAVAVESKYASARFDVPKCVRF